MRLVLGVNEPYRQIITQAARRSGLPHATIAALIEAEAARRPDGQWDPASSNPRSGAAGLTQFLAASWLWHAQDRRHLLGARAREMALVDRSDAARPEAVDRLLALRFDPLLSVVSAAEYGVENLRRLRRFGIRPPRGDADAAARLIYLAHHEGAPGAVGFLEGSRVYTADDLAYQLGEAARMHIEAHRGDANAAYRAWFTGYVEEMVVPARFRGELAAAAA